MLTATLHPRHSILILSLLLAAVMLVASFFYLYGEWWSTETYSPVVPLLIKKAPPPPPNLGTELYDKAQNPVKGKIPDTVPTVTNPIDGVYKNPFE